MRPSLFDDLLELLAEVPTDVVVGKVLGEWRGEPDDLVPSLRLLTRSLARLDPRKSAALDLAIGEILKAVEP